ncbi:MAG: DUF6387 family protein [Burkholderiales bacterium]
MTQEAVTEARKWFDLEKYRPVAQLNSAELASQISKRAFIRVALANPSEDNTAFLEQAIPALMADPMSPFDFRYNNRAYETNPSPLGTRTILPLSFNDIDRLNSLKSDFPEGGNGSVDEWSLKYPDLGLLQFGHLLVDLNARDEDIQEDFMRWLGKFRELAPKLPLSPYQKGIENRLSGWHLTELFPYFDLTAWSQFSRNNLSGENLTGLLYPRKEVDKSKLRKLKGKISKIINQTNAIALINAASYYN